MRVNKFFDILIRPLLIVAMILPILVSTTTYAAETIDKNQQEIQTENNAKQLEYIFTTLYHDDGNGRFIENKDAIKNSGYSEKDLKDIDIFVTAINGDTPSQPTTRAWNDTIKRCIADGKHVSKQVLEEIGREIRKGNWIAAGGKLAGAVGMAIPAALAFLVFCGAVPASR